ncbi:hypothetical protein ALP99_102271 [Pseudomonas syringae pv. tomato]|uniref:Uncharacterized protein n=1 Tax=Pseudomonas syringae pv. spinaceae TaxID=264459 RepID=A0A0N8TB42_PSESX|nr:hypothetical protein NB04_16760 [Pseudomonas syringae pv. tomato]KPZ06945.1 hypothetical protein ALO94_100849 [Pseudomonas syringae pv. spinaceae]KWT13288.1 hypothetical protein AL046_11635 [Pseudomonas syringae pv. avii]RMQ67557.1 hypothetical protein ALQ00_102170 [Pseudomonas syringae pv. tomato]RMQ76991.1 hypothetical protein ALP99_102271 [Pseudomonas syringae pv. tomato]
MPVYNETNVFLAQNFLALPHCIAIRNQAFRHPQQQRRLPTPINPHHQIETRLEVKMSIFVTTKILQVEVVEAHVGFLYQSGRMRQCTLAHPMRHRPMCD